MTVRSHSTILLLLVAACIPIASTGCAAPTGEGVAIYLTRDNIPPSQMEMLSHVELAAEPVISMDDIVSYDASTHEMTLAAEAFDRIAELEVPTSGKSFVVCVDRGPIYWGAFWSPLSSQSFDGVTIWKPFGTPDSTIVALELGYPSASFHQGDDPRNNPEVIASLERAGKLITTPPALRTDALPRSMKGYELYSWQEHSQWHFTLITGTNRNKTLEEVRSDTSIVSQDGWVQIHAVGVDEINRVLSRLPQDEYVSWLSGLRGEGGPGTALPPEPIVNAVKEHAS